MLPKPARICASHLPSVWLTAQRWAQPLTATSTHDPTPPNAPGRYPRATGRNPDSVYSRFLPFAMTAKPPRPYLHRHRPPPRPSVFAFVALGLLLAPVIVWALFTDFLRYGPRMAPKDNPDTD